MDWWLLLLLSLGERSLGEWGFCALKRVRVRAAEAVGAPLGEECFPPTPGSRIPPAPHGSFRHCWTRRARASEAVLVESELEGTQGMEREVNVLLHKNGEHSPDSF